MASCSFSSSQIKTVIRYLQLFYNLRQSSPEMASLAGEVLQDPDSDALEKRLSGSVLSQTRQKAIKKILGLANLVEKRRGAKRRISG